jgi:hypothetical protein
VKLVAATKMKCAVVATLVSLVFVSQASAVLRPLFPIKPSAPFNGELIVIGDELVLRSDKKASDASPGSGTLGECLDTKLSLLSRQLSLASATSRKDLRARETRHLLNARAEGDSSSVNRFRRRQLYSRHSLAVGL